MIEISFNKEETDLSPKDIKKLQKLMLEILVEVDRFCRKYNIIYWLDSGTLLGAIRHKGFIPWDDDIDICMPIEDYDKFINLFPRYGNRELFLQIRKTDKYFGRDFMKIRSNKGIVLEKIEAKKKRKLKHNKGIYIDIFPNMTIKNTNFYRTITLLLLIFIKSLPKYLSVFLIWRNNSLFPYLGNRFINLS